MLDRKGYNVVFDVIGRIDYNSTMLHLQQRLRKGLMIIRPGIRYIGPSCSVTTPLGQTQKGVQRLTATSEASANTVQALARGKLFLHDINTLLHTSFDSDTAIELDVNAVARSCYDCRD